MLDLSFRQLHTFREVARQGSVTKAARNLGFAQSSVTSHIKALEVKLGHPLFRRLPHGVRLTAHGKIVDEYAERVFRVMSEMSGALHPGGEAEGRVAIAADPLLVEQRIGRLIQETHYRYPKVQVSPRAAGALGVAGAVLRGDLPMGLVALGPDTPALPAELAVQTLPPLRLAPVGAPSLAGAAGLADELRKVRVLAVTDECSGHPPLLQALRRQYGIDAPLVEVGSVGGVRELVRSGYGIAMLPVDEGAGAQHLAVLPTLPAVELDVRVVHAPREQLGRAARAVFEVLRRQRPATSAAAEVA